MNHSFIQDTQEIIRNTIQSKGLIRITGSGTKDWFGAELKGDPLSTKSYQGIINYQPDELVITVKSGTSLKEVELALEEKINSLHLSLLTLVRAQRLVGWFALDLQGQEESAQEA